MVCKPFLSVSAAWIAVFLRSFYNRNEVNDMDYIKIGASIRQLRRERALTQKQLADGLHVSHKTVSKWECGVSHS